MNNTKLSAITSILVLATSLALAEVPTVGTGSNPTIPAPSAKKDGLVINVDKLKEKIEQELANDSGKTVFVKSFNIEGNKVVSTNVLMSALKPFVNKTLTMKEVNDAVAAVTNKYRQNGYFAAIAFVMPNAYKDGVLTISITKGSFGNVITDNKSLVSDDTVKMMFEQLKGADATDDLLNTRMGTVENFSGIKIDSMRFAKGSKPGEMDVFLKAVATPRVDGLVTADNYGSKSTGEYKLNASANVNSPFAIGDKLSFGGGFFCGWGTKHGSIDYVAPISSNGLSLGVGVSTTRYALGGTYASLDATGTTSTVQSRVSYPLIKNNTENLVVSVNPQIQYIKDEQIDASTQKKANVNVLGADYTKTTNIFNVPSSATVKLNYTFGRLSFNDATQASDDAKGANTQGGFAKLDCSTTVLSELDDKITLKNTLNTQFALSRKNLDSSLYITIGGASGVRAFPTTQESSSSGYIYTAELNYKLPNVNKYSQSAYLFYDVGRAFNADTSVVSYTSSTLQDVGIGYKAGYDKFFAKLELAHVVGATQVSGVPYYNTKGLFQFGAEW